MSRFALLALRSQQLRPIASGRFVDLQRDCFIEALHDLHGRFFSEVALAPVAESQGDYAATGLRMNELVEIPKFIIRPEQFHAWSVCGMCGWINSIFVLMP